jgi:hypothetical protein
VEPVTTTQRLLFPEEGSVIVTGDAADLDRRVAVGGLQRQVDLCAAADLDEQELAADHGDRVQLPVGTR